MLLARLGLRAGEVAGLRLEDFDWRRGELLVRGKGDHHERMPLPVDVGKAVVVISSMVVAAASSAACSCGCGLPWWGWGPGA